VHDNDRIFYLNNDIVLCRRGKIILCEQCRHRLLRSFTNYNTFILYSNLRAHNKFSVSDTKRNCNDKSESFYFSSNIMKHVCVLTAASVLQENNNVRETRVLPSH